MKISAVGSIVRYTIVQNFRNKTFYILLLFAGIMFVGSFLFSSLGGEQEKRLIFDLGNGCIEIFGLIMAVFSAVTIVLEEIESRTIYLVLSRPIKRYQYIIGRYLGLLCAVACSVVVMGGMHLAFLLFKGWEFDVRYFFIIGMTIEKIALIASVALFFSLFSTSAASSIVFTFFFWVLGHFTIEMKFLGERLTSFFPVLIMKGAYYIIPNLQYFNLRDQWELSQFSIRFIGLATVYAVVYSAVCIVISALLFNRKEF